MIKHILNITTSTLASSIRSWAGTSSTKQNYQPKNELVFFDREGCSECRLLREAFTALNLNITIMPCPRGGRNIKSLKKQSGSSTVPMLYDANNETRHVGLNQISTYVFSEYKGAEAPEKFRSWYARSTSAVASIIRLGAGLRARPSRPVRAPLTLYSFESSPFSRPVRELLCELEIPYRLVNLGKQQRADMGPAIARMHLGPYVPVKDSKREDFLKTHGDVQVPYLVDPNTDTALFESQKILEYLKKQYAL